jgi:hypothetical protein
MGLANVMFHVPLLFRLRIGLHPSPKAVVLLNSEARRGFSGIRCTKLVSKTGAPIFPPMDRFSLDQLVVEN